MLFYPFAHVTFFLRSWCRWTNFNSKTHNFSKYKRPRNKNNKSAVHGTNSFGQARVRPQCGNHTMYKLGWDEEWRDGVRKLNRPPCESSVVFVWKYCHIGPLARFHWLSLMSHLIVRTPYQIYVRTFSKQPSLKHARDKVVNKIIMQIICPPLIVLHLSLE